MLRTIQVQCNLNLPRRIFVTTCDFSKTIFQFTVKLGDKEWFDKEQLGVQEQF
jgi:hypothetical protein